MEFLKQVQKEDWTARLAKTQYLLKKYPDRIPVLIDRSNPESPKPDQHRFLVPIEMTTQVDGTAVTQPTTMAYFQTVARKHIPKLDQSQALYWYTYPANVIPAGSESLKQIYDKHANQDGFLMLIYSVETTFGNPDNTPQPDQ